MAIPKSFKSKYFIDDDDQRDSLGRSALHRAAESNDILLVEKLLSHKAEVNLKDHYCDTPLHWATLNNIDESHLEVIEVLLKNGANPNARNKFDQTPFWNLVKKGNLKAVNLFLYFKADVRATNCRGENFLLPAAGNYKNPEVLQLLINRGLEINRGCNAAWTALHTSAIQNENESHYEVAEILLNHGADPNARSSSDNTPLYYLVKKGNVKIVQLFLSFKADINVLNSNNESLLFAATENTKNIEVFQLLIDLGLNVNHCDSKDETPLHHATKKNEGESHFKIIEALLINKANANAIDIFQRTPLHGLVEKSNAKTVKLLLDFDVDVETVNDDGETALFPAVESNENAEVIQLLIDHGSNVKHENNIGMTPLRCALCSDFIKLKTIKCLVKNGADLNDADEYRSPPLIEAMIHDAMNNDSESGVRIIDNKISSCLIELIDFNMVFRSTDSNVLNVLHELKPHLWTMIIQHIAKLQSLNIPVHQSYLDTISKNSEYNCYYFQCQKELVRAQNTKLQNSTIFFYNLLVDNRKKLKNYAKNLVKEYETSNWDIEFPIYGSRMNENVKKAIRRRELFDKSSIALSDCLPIFKPNHLIIYDVLNCILSKKDLSTFCETS